MQSKSFIKEESMENIIEKPIATPEKIWELLMENARQMAESRAENEKRSAEYEKSRAEYEKRSAESRAEYERHSAESRAEYERQRAENLADYERRSAEYERKSAEYERQTAENRAEYERQAAESRAEYERHSAETSRKIREISEMIGGVSNSNGMFAEEFFLNAIDLGDKALFGEQFHECICYARRHNKALRLKIENDIILTNGDSVALIEIKYKARKEDVQKMIDSLPRFRALYPEYKNHRIYLGLAAMSFEKGVEKECIEKGIAIVKQAGNAVVLNDEHVKAY